MLDDLKYIHERDAQDSLGIAERQWRELEHDYHIVNADTLNGKVENIVYAGMGGSALAGIVSGVWPGYRVPFEVCRDYDIPHYVGPGTLFIAASYSGNTEETIAALTTAAERGAILVVIASGGKLEQIAADKNYAFLKLPKADQPRYAVLYNLRAIVEAAEHLNVFAVSEAQKELVSVESFLCESVKSWIATVPTSKNPAKELAQELMGLSPVVYSGPFLAPAAYKWKIGLNENAKNVAWWGVYPEFNHNEFIGWSEKPVDKPYAVIDLRSNLDHPRIQKRFEITERLLSGKRPAPHVVHAVGKTRLEQLLWTTAFGDFVSIYLGLLNGVNPAPVVLVEKLKKELE